MSLLRRAAQFARSPQGRRAIQEARTRLDTPENRQRVSETIARVRSSRGRGGATGAPAASDRRR